MGNCGTSKELYIASTPGKLEWIIIIQEPGIAILCNSLRCMIITHLKRNIIISYVLINAVRKNVMGLRNVIGWAASPASVTKPPLEFQGFVGQYDNLLCHTFVPSGIVLKTSLNGKPKALPRSYIAGSTLSPCRPVGSSDRQVCINIQVQSIGSSVEQS
jgi:hypothetical protein